MGDVIRACDNSTIYQQTTNRPALRVIFNSDDSVTASGFVIEWKAFRPEDLPKTVDCDFDGPVELCPGYTQSGQDSMDWIVNRGPTPSKYTGPEVDHTFGTKEGRYAFIEASKRKPMDNAILYSPLVRMKGDSCLSFWFLNRADNDDSGNLGGRLFVMERKEGNNETRDIFSTDEVTGETWKKAEVTIDNSQSRVQFGFDGQRGKSYKSDFAIDDIKLTEGSCKSSSEDTYGSEGGNYDGNYGNYDNYDFNLDTIACTSDEHECDGLCLPKSFVCNQVNDCSDGSDEA